MIMRWFLIVVLAIILAFVFASFAYPESTKQRDAPTTRFYNTDRSSAGNASTYGNVTKFYAPNGRLLGKTERK
jgi:hypothetical protein